MFKSIIQVHKNKWSMEISGVIGDEREIDQKIHKQERGNPLLARRLNSLSHPGDKDVRPSQMRYSGQTREKN